MQYSENIEECFAFDLFSCTPDDPRAVRFADYIVHNYICRYFENLKYRCFDLCFVAVLICRYFENTRKYRYFDHPRYK